MSNFDKRRLHWRFLQAPLKCSYMWFHTGPSEMGAELQFCATASEIGFHRDCVQPPL